MAAVEIVHTARLDTDTRTRLRALLDEAFDGRFTDDDWDHALGGLHVLVREDTGILAHAAVVQRRLLHGGRALRTGFVEGVCVRADQRRAGLGAVVMEAVNDLLAGAYELGALSASQAGARLYRRMGWQQWRGPTWALTPDGTVRTGADDDSVWVFATTAAPDPHGDLTCDWRDGDVW